MRRNQLLHTHTHTHTHTNTNTHKHTHTTHTPVPPAPCPDSSTPEHGAALHQWTQPSRPYLHLSVLSSASNFDFDFFQFLSQIFCSIDTIGFRFFVIFGSIDMLGS